MPGRYDQSREFYKRVTASPGSNAFNLQMHLIYTFMTSLTRAISFPRVPFKERQTALKEDDGHLGSFVC